MKRAYYEGQMERARQALQDEVRAQEPGTAMQQTPEEAAAGTRQPAAATQETVQPEVTGTTSGFATMQDTAPMVQSENPAVQQLAAAVQDGQLTSKTINLFTPNAANEANRAAFAEEYGVELPETEAKTRQVLREMTTQQRAAQAPATATENATVEAQNTAAIVEKMEDLRGRHRRKVSWAGAELPWRTPGKGWKAARRNSLAGCGKLTALNSRA